MKILTFFCFCLTLISIKTFGQELFNCEYTPLSQGRELLVGTIAQTFKSCVTGRIQTIGVEYGPTVQPFYDGLKINVKNEECEIIASTTWPGPNPGLNIIFFVNQPLLIEGESYSISFEGNNCPNCLTFISRSSVPYDDGYLAISSDCSPVGNGNDDLSFNIIMGLEPLPIELKSFESQKSDQGIYLSWTTVSELNNKGFEIERSSDGEQWTYMDFIEGAGSSQEIQTYAYTDNQPNRGMNYYRLKQIDFDGAHEYSNIIAVEHKDLRKQVEVYPNPSTQDILIQVSNPTGEDMKIFVLDNLGKKVWESVWIGDQIEWNKELGIDEHGVYFVTVQIGNEVEYERVVVLGN